MIQAALLSRGISNADSLPEMRALLQKYSSTKGDLGFLNAVHVAGSKGKGSVCAMVESILRRGAGMKTGMFTSPHLIHPRERIRIDGRPVEEERFAKHVLALNERLQAGGELVSFFRFLWMVAIEVFREEGVQVGIIEVGIGGRFDATNVLERPVVCGITSLAMEHVALLGPSIREIAWNKAGIMKPGVPVYAVLQDFAEATAVLESEAKTVGVKGEVVRWCEALQELTDLGIDGDHQLLNAALAWKLAQKWIQAQGLPELPSAVIEEALRLVRWPGRHQKHQLSKDCCLYLDGCHTVESVQYCATWFIKEYCTSLMKNHLVFHCSIDRDYRALLQPLLSIPFESVFFAIPQHLAPSSKENCAALLKHHHDMAAYWTEKTGREALVLTSMNEGFFSLLDGRVLVCGSLYLVGEVMGIFELGE